MCVNEGHLAPREGELSKAAGSGVPGGWHEWVVPTPAPNHAAPNPQSPGSFPWGSARRRRRRRRRRRSRGFSELLLGFQGNET